MSKCPFWSNKKQKVECNSECPLLTDESTKDVDDKCVFCECAVDVDADSNIDMQVVKEQYNFINIPVH